MVLEALTQEQGYLKAGFFGFNKSGKTFTAALLAIGLRKHFKLKGPIAFFDTENSAQYVRPLIQRETGLDLVGKRSRSFDDLVTFLDDCVEAGVSVAMIDSITHPWVELNKTYLDQVNANRARNGKPPKPKTTFSDMQYIKAKWATFTEKYINIALHIITCGRAGYEWDWETDEDTDTKNLVKKGVKTKTEGEFGFEPSLLSYMERIQVNTPEGLPKITHRATVIGDRFDVLDGENFTDPTFESFLPHIQLLDGKSTPNVKIAGTIHEISDGNSEFYNRRRDRKIVAEEIQGAITECFPGQTKEEKSAKTKLLEMFFETKSWTMIEEKMSVDRMERGCIDLTEYLNKGDFSAILPEKAASESKTGGKK